MGFLMFLTKCDLFDAKPAGRRRITCVFFLNCRNKISAKFSYWGERIS